MVDENKNYIIIFKCDEGVAVASGILSVISGTLGDSVDNVTQQFQELSTSFEIEVKPNMAESIEKLFGVKIIEDLKYDDIVIKHKYSQPPYRERMHPKNVVVFRKCRIRNRPNSGHGFKQ